MCEFVALCQSSDSYHQKSNVMLIGSHQKLRNNYDSCISVDGKQLSHVPSVRYLGLRIDENLSWHQHMANVIQRVYSSIQMEGDLGAKRLWRLTQGIV